MAGVQQLVRLGHDVRVFTFRFPWQTPDIQMRAAQYLASDVEMMDYRADPPNSLAAVARRIAAAVRQPALLDGSAMAMAHPDVLDRFEQLLRDWRPDVVWCDYTNLWPFVERAGTRNVATVVRSINFEPQHNLDEGGGNLVNRARYFTKYLSERASMSSAGAFAAITPADRAEYLRLGRSDCAVLPLRSLPELLRPPRPIRRREPLDVFFLGSNYNVSHNRAALAFILENVVPAVRRAAPGAFRFNLLGGKPPADLMKHGADDVRMQGFVPDLNAFLDDMDIAFVPSLYGGGMQQKIFEPICRAFPAVVSARGLAAYPLRDGEHVLLAETPEQSVAALLRLRDPALRAQLSAGASAFAAAHFNTNASDATVSELLRVAVTRAGAHGSA